MMSVDFPASLPSWKLALIERKRRQETDPHVPLGSGKSGLEGSTLPPWRQEILSKKQQKRYPGIKRHDCETRQSLAEILLSPEDSKKCGGTYPQWPVLLSPNRGEGLLESLSQGTGFGDERGIPLEERLPPFHRNPILLMDLENRRPGGIAPESNSLQKSGVLSRLRVCSHMSFDGDLVDSSGAEISGYDEIVKEEEVIYGKGFVSRLLQKFSDLAGREETYCSGPHFAQTLSRGQSNDDFLDGQFESGSKLTQQQPRKKASSLDDLLKQNVYDHSVSENGYQNDAKDECVLWPKPSGEGRMVLNVKNIFENLATSPTSSKSWMLRDQNVLSPEQPGKQNVLDVTRNEASPIVTPAVIHSHSPQSPSGFPKSFQKDGTKRFAQSHAIISDAPPNSFKRQSSFGENKLSTGSDFGVALREEDHDNIKNTAQISSRKTEILDHSAPSLRENNAGNTFVMKNLRETRINDIEMKAGHHILQKSDDQMQDQNCSVTSGSVENKAQSGSSLPLGNSAAPKKIPPRPGLLLIRPASNLFSVKTDNLQMTKYNDIKHGDFVPAKRPALKNADDDDDGELDLDEFEETLDISKFLRTARFEFEGAGVCVGRSLLAKSKQGIQLKTKFDDAATSVYEYPSEQSLVDSWPPLDSANSGQRDGWEDGPQTFLGASHA